MGMDYRYAGSASYSRFSYEITEVAKLFDAVETVDLINAKKKFEEKNLDENGNIINFDYFFGYGMDVKHKYSFPNGTNETLVKWFNNPYGDYTVEETKEIYEEINKKREEVEEISEQIMYELDRLVDNSDYWYIF